MKKIVLRKLPWDVERIITKRMRRENLSRAEVVIEFLREAALDQAIQHDVALAQSWFDDHEDTDPTIDAECSGIDCCIHSVG